jgi:nicotinamidase-related amidase
MAAPAKNRDLHGSAPDTSPVALILIDVINDLEFDGGDRLLEHALPMARALADLKRRCREAGIPAVYVNDNFGRWQEDQQKIVAHVIDGDRRGRPVVELLRPEPDDYFVIKPKHSGFFSTNLDTLLAYLQARTLILTGIATNICVLFTANDAYMRDYELVIPADCVAAEDPRESEHSLEQMRTVLKACVRPSSELDVRALVARTRPACDDE